NHTDFILASVGEELGFVGICVIIGLYCLLLWRGFMAARDAPDRFGA
ncbi:MAG: FtsW/RodA/SpoVE family cell cycle protein, partial [Myxococcales bacterium]|nr:FtsW/RodA/SpoVE family cell cycle protein [Myxococcales bacterium]